MNVRVQGSLMATLNTRDAGVFSALGTVGASILTNNFYAFTRLEINID